MIKNILVVWEVIKTLFPMLAITIICFTFFNCVKVSRTPSPYESFNKVYSECTNTICRTQVVTFYKQAINDIEEIRSEKKFEERQRVR